MASAPSTHWFICAQVADNIGKLKAVAGFLQILASIPMVFGDTLILPYVYAQLLKLLNVFMLGLVDLVPTRCLSTVSDEVFYVRMVLLTTIAPVAIALLLATAFKLDDVTREWGDELTRRDKLVTKFRALDADGDDSLSLAEFRRAVVSATRQDAPPEQKLALDP